MSGETNKDVSGLTVDTLKLLVESELRRVDDRFAAFLEVYRRDQEKANEFRSALDDLGKDMATRREMNTLGEAFTQRLDVLQNQIIELRSRLDIGPAQIPQLQAYQYQQQGRQAGIGASFGAIGTAITVAVAVIGIIVVLTNILTS